MSWDLLERSRRNTPDSGQIQTLQERALKDLASARALRRAIPNGSTSSRTRRCSAGKCLLCQGYRPRGRISQTIITAMSAVGGAAPALVS
jgi:hypothetical protein